MIDLLKLAAKAARYDIDWECEINGYYAHGRDADGDVDEWWDPASSDADAFQLAADCRLELSFGWEQVRAAAEITGKHSVSYSRAITPETRAQEMRGAILDAAAEMGRWMV